MRAVRVPVFAFLLALLMAGASFGDALVVVKAMRATTVCEIFIEAGVVRTELEIGVQSLPVFANLLPTEVRTRLGLEGKALKERLPAFFAEDWTVLADGEPLPGRLVAIEGRRRLPRDEISGEVTAADDDAGEPVLFVVIEHPFEGRPKQLTIRPALLTRDARTSTDIGFVLWHGGIPVTDFRYLPGAVTVDLDWDDPWYSRFQHRNLRRTFAAPMMGFLYVEPFEVRREIVARPVDLQTWVDLGIDGDVIPAAAQGKLKEKVAAFLKDRCPVTVDGKAIEPVLDRIHFLRRTLRSTTVIEPPEDLPLSSALLGIIFAYPIEGLPQRATMTWDLWSERVPQVPATATDEAGGLPSILTPTDPVLTWQNFLKHPTSTGLVPVRDPPPPLTWPLPAFLLLLVVVGGALVYLRRGKPRPAAAFALIGCLLAVALLVLGACARPEEAPRSLAEFQALSQQNLGRAGVPDLTGLDPVADWSLVLRIERAAETPEQKPWDAPLFLHGVRSLTPVEAATLAAFPGSHVFLPELASLDEEVARALTAGRGYALYLDGLRELDATVAARLVAGDHDSLSFRSLGALDLRTARILARQGRTLRLDGLRELTPEAARALARWEGWGEAVLLSLGGLEALPVDVAHELASCRGWGMSLNGLRELTPDVARELGTLDMPFLSLDGLASISVDTAAVMATWRRKFLTLDGLTTLSPEVRGQLEEGCEALSLRGLAKN